MHGNLWEWVADCWHAGYDDAPSNGSPWRVGRKSRRSCAQRVLRGGSWISAPKDLRSANREPALAGKRSDIAGFRIARTLTQ
jgi:formylglycine-generating enzyme required for sulfatase activity